MMLQQVCSVAKRVQQRGICYGCALTLRRLLRLWRGACSALFNARFFPRTPAATRAALGSHGKSFFKCAEQTRRRLGLDNVIEHPLGIFHPTVEADGLLTRRMVMMATACAYSKFQSDCVGYRPSMTNDLTIIIVHLTPES